MLHTSTAHHTAASTLLSLFLGALQSKWYKTQKQLGAAVASCQYVYALFSIARGLHFVSEKINIFVTTGISSFYCGSMTISECVSNVSIDTAMAWC